MYFIVKLSESKLFKIIAFNLIIVFILMLAPPVHAQDSNEQLLRDGIKLYEEGKLDEAIIKLSSCVEKKDLTNEQLTEAYKYLAQAYMAKEFRDQAKQAVEKLLTIMPKYKADPIQDRPQYIALVEKVRQEQQLKPVRQDKVPPPIVLAKKKSPIIKWALIGAGAVVGVVLAIVLLSSKNKDAELPMPPALPGS